MQDPQPQDPIDALLSGWTEPEGLRRDLTGEVRRRIARARLETRSGGFLAAAAFWFTRPPFAALFVGCCALIGVLLAEIRVDRRERADQAALVQSYLQLIDPLAGSAAPPRR